MNIPVHEIIDPVFAKTSQNARFLLSENERFGLVFMKTGSINSSTDHFSESLETVFWAKKLKLFDADPDPQHWVQYIGNFFDFTLQKRR
jgi:hypothetical protein